MILPKWLKKQEKAKKCNLRDIERFVLENQFVTTKDIVKKFGIHQRKALDFLYELVEKGKVKKIGYVYYPSSLKKVERCRSG